MAAEDGVTQPGPAPPAAAGALSPRHAEQLTAFPPQFPLASGGGPLGKFGVLLAPRFADVHFERRFREHRATRKRKQAPAFRMTAPDGGGSSATASAPAPQTRTPGR